ncbi:MAG: hypothetical protein ACM30E_12510 [Nitrososphaerales archaeon]
MEDTKSPEIITVSGACCAPHMAKLDQALEKALQEALADLGLAVQIRKVSLSAVLNFSQELPPEPRKQVLALFQRYNLRCAPMVLINGQVRFAGVPPSAQQVKEALRAAVPSPQATTRASAGGCCGSDSGSGSGCCG